MIKLLTNISKLEATEDIILLSKSGEMLFGRLPSTPAGAEQQMTAWKKVVTLLETPMTAEFMFDQGMYYLCSTNVGYLVVALQNVLSLDEVKAACADLQAGLSNSAERKKAFLTMLHEVEDILKPQIIEELSPYADREIAKNLVAVLRNHKKFQSHVKDKLLILICQTLGHCSTVEAARPLKQFLHECRENGTLTQAVEQAAQVSIKQLELDKPLEKSTSVESAPKSDGNISPVTTEKPTIQPAPKRSTPEISDYPEKAKVEALLAQGQKKEAAILLLGIIEQVAQQKKFDLAEKLRGLIIEVDSMMLTEIIRAAEIIEEEKIASIQPEHLEIWSDLAGMLSQDEFSTLYHSFTEKKCINGELIVKQGAFLSQLFFINSGQVQLYAVAEGKEIPLKTMGPGEIMGGGTFFEASVWTLNARSLGVELFVLSRRKLEKLVEEHPALESKLNDFCSAFTSSRELFKKTRRSRRRYERKKISGRASISLLDREGKDTGSGFKGELSDISRGGLSFIVNISRKRNALLLFGGRLRISIPTGSGLKKSHYVHTGRIVAVRGHHVVSNEYSIHVEFGKALEYQEVQKIIEFE